MLLGEVSIIDRRYLATDDFFYIAAVANPFRAQRRQTFGDIDMLIGVAPRAAGVVNADRLVHFDLAAHRFRRGERDFAEGNAQIAMQLAFEVDLPRVGERSLRQD